MSDPNTSALRPARSGPTGLATVLRLSGGVALIFLSFTAMNLLSRYAATAAVPYAAAEPPALQELNENATPDALEIFDDLDDIQPEQPADSSGALPPEAPDVDHT